MGNNQHPKNCDGAYIKLGNVLADGPLPAAANIITEGKASLEPVAFRNPSRHDTTTYSSPP